MSTTTAIAPYTSPASLLLHLEGARAFQIIESRQRTPAPRFATGVQPGGVRTGGLLRAPTWVGQIMQDLAKLLGVRGGTPAEIQAGGVITARQAWAGALPAWVINIEVGRTGWRQILADGASVADVEAIALQACPGATVGSEVIARMGGRTYVRLSVQPA